MCFKPFMNDHRPVLQRLTILAIFPDTEDIISYFLGEEYTHMNDLTIALEVILKLLIMIIVQLFSNLITSWNIPSANPG